MTTKKATKSKLEIKHKDLQKNVLRLFEEMQQNKSMMDSFIHNPTEQIVNKVMRKKLPPQQISEANRLLFSLIANDEMLNWLNNYNKDMSGGKIDKKQFAMDFAKEISKLGDENILVSLISNAVQGYGIPGLGDIAYQCVCNETPNKNECACTPVAKDQLSLPDGVRIKPEMLRAITEHLVSYAKKLRSEGKLSNLATPIR